MLLCCLPMIHGCAHGGSEVVKLDTPIVVDTTAARCPAADPAARAVLTSRVPAPGPDPLTKGAWQKKTDELRRDVEAKSKAGLAIADELDRCRGVDAVVATNNTAR